MAGHQYLGTSAQVEPQPHGALDHFQLEKVVRATVVGVHEQPVGRPSLELHLQRAVDARVPLPELAIGAVQHQTTGGAHHGGYAPDRDRRHRGGGLRRRPCHDGADEAEASAVVVSTAIGRPAAITAARLLPPSYASEFPRPRPLPYDHLTITNINHRIRRD